MSNLFKRLSLAMLIAASLTSFTSAQEMTGPSGGEVFKMHADGNDSSVIAFKNGDLVTGTVELETVKLKTDWGTAHINTSQIEQITSDQSARFFSDSSGTGAKAWRFQRTPPPAQRRSISSPNGFGIGRPGQ